MIDLPRLAEQQKNQSAEKFNNGILKQIHDVQLADTFKPITNNLTQVFRKPNFEDGNPQTAPIQNITGTQSLRDTLTLMKGSNFFSN